MRWISAAGVVVAAAAFAQPVRAPFHVSYDAEHLDLDHHVLQFRMSRPAGSAELAVIGEDGGDIGHGAATYHGEPADTWLSLAWDQPGGGRVLMLKLRGVAADGKVTHVELTPWSVTIDHEDVNFATNSAAIEAGE